MHPLLRRRSATVAAFLVGLVLTAPALASDPKPGDPKALDRYLYTNLRFVINHGVDLYNAGRVEDCFDHFRQALVDLGTVLDSHPDLQKQIKDGLDKVEKDPEWRAKMAAKATMPNPETAPLIRQKAFALRAVFNDVRAGLSPEPKKPTPPTNMTLWDKLGGEKSVAKVVDDFCALASADPKVDVTRGGKYKLDELALADLKKKLVQFISSATGGPLKYTGKSMKEVHKGMGITNEQFDAAGADLKKALTKNNVKAEDADALLKIVDSTRKDIVEETKVVPPRPTESGTVKGKATVDGKPLAKGTVALIDKDGKAYSGAIAADGTFSVEKVPAGTYKVTVTDAKGVPAAYGDVKTTSLTSNVKAGMNELNLDLK